MIDELVLEAWRTLLADRLGLSFNELSPVLNRGIEQFCDQNGMTPLDAEHTLKLLDIDHPLWQTVRDLMVVSSSRFFRDPDIFSEIETWLATYERDKPLKIVSFGAADGREAYSLGMFLAEAGVPYNIVGIDISPKAIHQARQAIYFDRDLDEIPEKYRAKYIQSGGASRFTLTAQICSSIDFIEPWEVHQYVPLAADIICCQNTLMYLTEEKKMTQLAWFERHLSPGGLLLLSPTDVPKWCGKHLERLVTTRVRAFRRLDEVEA
jgi:chemotaxis protein methyltransferase CheR